MRLSYWSTVKEACLSVPSSREKECDCYRRGRGPWIGSEIRHTVDTALGVDGL